MRPSNREKILEAAIAVVAERGVAAVTFESVAAASGVSRGGVLYHFATKDDLLLALHEYLAARWEGHMVAALGGPPERATVDERVAAYAKVSSRSASGAELLLMIEASLHEDLRRPYAEVSARWVQGAGAVAPDDAVGLDRLIAVLAADGLWASDSITGLSISPALRQVLADRIVRNLGARLP